MTILTVEKQTKLQTILLNFLEEARLKNPSFGVRALALKLQMSPGSLSEIMSGKRRISKEKTKLILDRLAIHPLLSQDLLREENVGETSAKDSLLERNSIQLNLDHYHILTEWQHYAILNLIETKGFKYDHKIIAQRLGLSVEVVRVSFEKLFRLEMVEIKRGKLRRTNVRYKTSEDVSNSAIKKYHRNALSKAEEALDKLRVEERDFSAMILPLNLTKLPEIKEKLRKFQNQILNEFSDNKSTEVFQISMQVFPLSTPEVEMENQDRDV